MKKERDPTSEEFEKLLAWLDPDREAAGAKYEILYYRLLRIFAARGCFEPETLADEVMNRVAVRIDKLTENYPSPTKCIYGFVGPVFKEWLRDQREVPLKPDIDPPAPEPQNSEDEKKENECLADCMGKLSPQENQLFRQYFSEHEQTKIAGRKKLAEQLGLSANALRIKAHRIRRTLGTCMEACFESLDR